MSERFEPILELAGLRRAESAAARDWVEAWRKHHGITDLALARAGQHFGLVSCRVDCVEPSAGLYCPADGPKAGTPALILMVWSDRFEAFTAPDGSGIVTAPVFGHKRELVDLLAIDPHDPTAWLRRTGHAAALGQWVIDGMASPMAWDDNKVVRLCRDPVGWLRALGEVDAEWGTDAVCLLDPAYFAEMDDSLWDAGSRLRLALGPAKAIVCDDDDHAAEIQRLMRAEPPKPRLPDLLVVEAGQAEGVAA